MLDYTRRLACLLRKWIRQVWLGELDVDHVFSLWVVRVDLLVVSPGGFTSVLVLGNLALFHVAIKFELLEHVALGSLHWVH